MSMMSMRPRGAGAIFMLSPEMHRMLRMPRSAAPITSDCRPTRVRSRAAICITGSAPCLRDRTEHAQEAVRGVADGLSVKFTAAT